MAFTVYWNNICLLSKVEKAFIAQALGKEDAFAFTYYGLGQAMPLSKKIDQELRDGSHDADIVVSTDLEVFQNPKYAPYFSSCQPLPSMTFDKPWLKDINHPEQRYLPFIVIPLVLAMHEHCPIRSLKDLIDAQGKVSYAFGGIHNSAGQSLLKAIWYLYGEDAVKAFLKHAKIASMPAQAYQFFAQGLVEVSIVPTIFAMRSVAKGAVFLAPSEGAVAIPSYVAVQKSVPVETINNFKARFLNDAFKSMLVEGGDIWLPEDAHRDVLIPPWHFFQTFDHDAFDALCAAYQ